MPAHSEHLRYLRLLAQRYPTVAAAASEIIRLSGVDATVAPCTSAEYSAKHPAAADRPAWSALENRMLACTVGNHMRDWKEALADFFARWNGE